MLKRIKRVLFFAVCVMMLLFACSCGSSSGDPSGNESTPETEAVTAVPESQADDVRDTETEADTEQNRQIGVGEKNALEKADSYLSISAFSKEGLKDQLLYEQFTEEEAQYAVDNCGADWKEQAYLKAQDYLELTAFSKDGLIDQLEYDKFTHEEAVYGVDKAYQ